MKTLTEETIKAFEQELLYREKAPATTQKYGQVLRDFARFLAGRAMSKELLLAYRSLLLETHKPQTVNGSLTAIHAYLAFCGASDLRVNLLRVQRRAFLDESRELSAAEYKQLLLTARRKGNRRLYLVMMTLCSAGLRVSELSHITVASAKAGQAQICMKGKFRTVLLPEKLCQKLLRYARERGITQGVIFRTRSGRPLDRVNIYHDMKKLSREAGVDPQKVFPHNLRHLFARTFFALERNIAHLADVLGHSRIETTRIYTAVSAAAHSRVLNKMRLVT